MQFFVRLTSSVPPDFPTRERERLVLDERERVRDLMRTGKIVAVWKVPLSATSISVWETTGPEELNTLLGSLPAASWADAHVTALVPRNLQQHAPPS